MKIKLIFKKIIMCQEQNFLVNLFVIKHSFALRLWHSKTESKILKDFCKKIIYYITVWYQQGGVLTERDAFKNSTDV